MEKNKTCCFTGHRKQKLPWRGNENDARCVAVGAELTEEIEKAILRGYDTFICGMALGFDIMCAEAVIGLKEKYPSVKLIAALPCLNQETKWQERDKQRYRLALSETDAARCIYEEYAGAECMLERNRYMVDNSSLLIAYYNGASGGTKSTLAYAEKQGLEIIYIDRKREAEQLKISD